MSDSDDMDYAIKKKEKDQIKKLKKEFEEKEAENEDEIAKLKDNIFSLKRLHKNELQKLQSDLEEKTDIIDELKRKLKRMNKNVNYTSEDSFSHEEVENKSLELKALEESLKLKDGLIHDLESKLTKEKCLVEEFKEKIDSSTEILTQKNEGSKDLENNNFILENDLMNLRNENMQLEKNIKELTKQLDNTKIALSEKDEKIEELVKVKEFLGKQLESKKITDQYSPKETVANNNDITFKDMMQDEIKMNGHSQELLREINGITKQKFKKIDDFTEYLKNLINESESKLKNQYGEGGARYKNESRSKEIEALEDKVDDLEKKYRDLQRSTNKQLSSKEEQIKELEDELKIGYGPKMTKDKMKMKSFENELNEMEEELTQKEQERRKLDKLLNNKRRQLDQAETEIENLKMTIDQMVSEKRILQDQLQNIKMELNKEINLKDKLNGKATGLVSQFERDKGKPNIIKNELETKGKGYNYYLKDKGIINKFDSKVKNFDTRIGCERVKDPRITKRNVEMEVKNYINQELLKNYFGGQNTGFR